MLKTIFKTDNIFELKLGFKISKATNNQCKNQKGCNSLDDLLTNHL